jgi:hypothetical protein
LSVRKKLLDVNPHCLLVLHVVVVASVAEEEAEAAAEAALQ